MGARTTIVLGGKFFREKNPATVIIVAFKETMKIPGDAEFLLATELFCHLCATHPLFLDYVASSELNCATVSYSVWMLPECMKNCLNSGGSSKNVIFL